MRFALPERVTPSRYRFRHIFADESIVLGDKRDDRDYARAYWHHWMRRQYKHPVTLVSNVIPSVSEIDNDTQVLWLPHVMQRSCDPSSAIFWLTSNHRQVDLEGIVCIAGL